MKQQEERKTPSSEYAALPGEILISLTEAAKAHNVTRLCQCLEQLGQIVENGHPVLEELHRLYENYDMDGILKYQEAIRQEEEYE